MRTETHMQKCRRREAEGGTVRYSEYEPDVRRTRIGQNHERLRPGWHWRAWERMKGLFPHTANPFPEPPAERPPLIDRDLLERQERDAESRRLKPGERRTLKSQLWPRFGAKEMAR